MMQGKTGTYRRMQALPVSERLRKALFAVAAPAAKNGDGQ